MIMSKKSIKILMYPILTSVLIIFIALNLSKYILVSTTLKLFLSILFTNFALLTPILFKKSRRIFLDGLLNITKLNLKLIPQTLFYYICFNIITFAIVSIAEKTQIFTNIFQQQVGVIDVLSQYNGPLILLFLFIGIIGPIIEELYFRNFIQQNLKKFFNTGFSLIIQAIIFGLLHGEIQSLGFVVIWGIFLGIIRERQNIYYSISLHALVNTVSFLILF